MPKVCIDSGPVRMVLTNYSVPNTAAFDDIVVPENPDRIYLELIGPAGVSGSVAHFSFGEPYSTSKPSLQLRAGERKVFDTVVPMGDVYLHTDSGITVGAFEGVPYEETE